MTRPYGHRFVNVASLLGLCLAIVAPFAHPSQTSRASVDSSGNQGNAVSSLYCGCELSADGRRVVFTSDADNLVPGDTNRMGDVFVRDLQTTETTRVSVSSAGAEGDEGSGFPTISADGRTAAFVGAASNLVPGDTNGTFDIFVRDLQTNQTTRVSVDSAGNQANSISLYTALSADGRYVAFVSAADNLVPDDTNGAMDVFVHDRQTGRTTRVSVDSAGREGDGASYSPALSADGQCVAFASEATNLVAGDTNGGADVFVHDCQSGRTTRVSVDSAGNQGTGFSTWPSLSADGGTVAFYSDAADLVPGDTNGVADVFVHDCQSGRTTRASVSSAGVEGNADSLYCALSADGQAVAFTSAAGNFVVADTNATDDVFLRDLRTSATTRVSVSSAGEQADADSGYPTISADGRVVAFNSSATNLVADDTNGVGDVFVSAAAAGVGTSLAVPDVTAMVGHSVNLTATLKAGALGLAGRTVSFSVGGTPAGTAPTGSAGLATIAYTCTAGVMAREIGATFAGDATYQACAGAGTLQLVPPTPSSITIVEDPVTLTAGQSQTYTVIDNNGYDVTGSCLLYADRGAGGTWGGATYTSERVGQWTISAVYNTLSDTASLTVTPATVAGLVLTPAHAEVSAGRTQVYVATASDALGNSWQPLLPASAWTVTVIGGGTQSGTFDATNTYQSVPADAGKRLAITFRFGGQTSNQSELSLTNGSGGYTLAWDHHTRAFYLCADAATPETGMPVALGTNTYTVGGRDVTVRVTGGTSDQTASILNCARANSLRVRWYLNGGALYRVYQTGTIAGVARVQNWVAPTAFGGLTHTAGGYTAGTPGAWTTVTPGTAAQP